MVGAGLGGGPRSNVWMVGGGSGSSKAGKGARGSRCRIDLPLSREWLANGTYQRMGLAL